MKIKKFIMTHFQINSRSLKKIALFLRKSKDINPMEMSLDLIFGVNISDQNYFFFD